ncbi:F-box protein At1g49360-like [Papaver somniferum]|uniref:F-box protein At1g49360-like n=1 Tax=Papaver somniferum TaxID=3469 RepID=UPI000E6FBC15|nr:F-box protein At1g49360-like [Papaver somniferum]
MLYNRSWNYGDCFLWNPATNERIQLPTLLGFCEDYYRFTDCVLSSPPRRADNDSMVLFFLDNGFHVEHRYTFLFCRPGETQWRSQNLSPNMLDLIAKGTPRSVLCFKGKLYLMCTYDNQTDEHHLEIQHDTDLTISIESFHVKEEVPFPLIVKAYPESHYVESHDELFRVDFILNRHTDGVMSIEVVRLNFSLMEWEKVNSFGDHVLFIGSTHTTGCCSAAEWGFKRGCLYYLMWTDLSLIHKFEIESSGDTICTSQSGEFYYTDWVTMPGNLHGRVAYILGGKDELKIEKTTSMVVNDENQGGNCNSGEVEGLSHWNDLNEDIVGLIADLLHGSDYKHFRSVCKLNRDIIPKVQKTSYLSPWLVFSRDQTDTIFNVVNPMYNDETYSINLSDLPDYTIRFQKDGWLLMTRERNVLFYNPLTRQKVKLPDMDRDNYYSVVSFSSLPYSSDCMVFAMDGRRDWNFYIDFITRGEEHWSSHIFRDPGITPLSFLDTAFFRDGAFFCVDSHHGYVGVFSAKDKTWNVLQRPHGTYFDGVSPGFLVECGGDILMVKLAYRSQMIIIFRLNFSEMKWERVESMGEHVLFISHTSCISAVAPNSYMKNKIYFPRLYINAENVFYSVEIRHYHSLWGKHSANDLSHTQGWFKNCTWIEPNMLMSTTEELDWLKTPF